MRFAAPEWFLLLPLLGLAVWYWKALRVPLRLLCLLLVLLLMCEPQVRRFGSGLDVWVLADRSASAARCVETRLPEWEQILRHAKTSDDRIFIVDYASEAALRDLGESVGSREATRTGLAIRYALSQMPTHRAARLLVLTDGYSMDSLLDLTERLARQKIPLDYRLAQDEVARECRIESFIAKPRAQRGEPFLLEARVRREVVSGFGDVVVDHSN